MSETSTTDSVVKCEVEARTLAEILRRAVLVAPYENDAARAQLETVLIEFGERKLTFTAADGYMLLIQSIPLADSLDEVISFQLRRSDALLWAKVCKRYVKAARLKSDIPMATIEIRQHALGSTARLDLAGGAPPAESGATTMVVRPNLGKFPDHSRDLVPSLTEEPVAGHGRVALSPRLIARLAEIMAVGRYGIRGPGISRWHIGTDPVKPVLVTFLAGADGEQVECEFVLMPMRVAWDD